MKPITFPSAGNHEYKTAGAQGYFDYFNGAAYSTGRAGDRDKGYYSFDVGTWHLIALNSGDHCVPVGCGKGSPQEQWLRADLAAHPTAVHARVLAPPALQLRPRTATPRSCRRSSRTSTTPTPTSCSAATHTTTSASRRRTRRASSTTRAASGSSWSGTGGAFFTALSTTKPNSQVRNASTYGVLMLTLHPNSYDWRFVPEAGQDLHRLGQRHVPRRRPGLPPAGAPADPRRGRRAAEGRRAKGQPPASCTIVGTPGHDVLAGTPDADVICGLGGRRPHLRLAAATTWSAAAPGSDRLSGGDGDDDLLGGRGRDRCSAAGDTTSCTATSQATGCTARAATTGSWVRAAATACTATRGNDVLIATLNRRGVDRVDGGSGRDRARVDRGDRVRSAMPRVRQPLTARKDRRAAGSRGCGPPPVGAFGRPEDCAGVSRDRREALSIAAAAPHAAPPSRLWTERAPERAFRGSAASSTAAGGGRLRSG